MSSLRALPEPGDPNTLYAVDLNAYVWRFIAGARDYAGDAFVRWLSHLIEHRKPVRLVFADDPKGKTFRHAMLSDAGLLGSDGYKGDRKRDPGLIELLIETRERAYQALNDADIPVYVADGYEADDVLATLASGTEDTKLDCCVIVTGDRDALQLVSACSLPKVLVWDGYLKVFASDSDVEKLLGVPVASRVADYFALVGGKNNVPGVEKIGDVAARELLARHSLEELLSKAFAFVLPHRWEEEMGVRPKLGALVRAGREMAELSLKLTTLCRTAPLRRVC